MLWPETANPSGTHSGNQEVSILGLSLKGWRVPINGTQPSLELGHPNIESLTLITSPGGAEKAVPVPARRLESSNILNEDVLQSGSEQ